LLVEVELECERMRELIFFVISSILSSLLKVLICEFIREMRFDWSGRGRERGERGIQSTDEGERLQVVERKETEGEVMMDRQIE
jgi:hypothetical protein